MKYDCPSCGQPFNGKRCRNCGYESFNEEIAHRLHTHKGEPLVIKDTTRRPIPRQDPFACPPRRRKRRFPSGIIIPLCALAMVLISRLSYLPFLQRPVLFGFTPSSQTEQWLPEDSSILYADGTLTVYSAWDGTTLENIPLFLQSTQKVHVKVTNFTVNGYCLDDYCYLSEDLPQNTLVGTSLYLDESALELCQIAQLQSISFQLELLEQDSWKYLSTTVPISISVEAPADYVQPDCSQGPLVYEKNGLRVVYRGVKLLYDGAPSYAEFYLYIENTTDEDLSVYTQNSTMDGENVGLRFWLDLPAHSKTVTRAILNDLEFTSTEEIHNISTELWYTDQDLNIYNDSIEIPVNS